MKRNVFSCFFLKEPREVAVVTLVGRLFHARAAVTRKGRSPLTDGSESCSRYDQALLRAGPQSSQRLHFVSPLKIAEEVWRRHVVTAAKNEYSQSKLYSFRNPQPVEVPEKMCGVVVLLRVTDQTCCSIKHRLQTVQHVTGKTSQGQLITIVRLSFQLIVACYCGYVFRYY